ncbi:MAG TPA: DUF202 domain-containing protein [Candidatus Bilamarchaeum sp.]|nr:DUF202 domain-containing protein [Candidatus Bilamarchaeum sp.]
MAYENNCKEELILRDRLAIERTKMAEERTYLAYIRTGMSVMLGGIFFIGYFEPGTVFAFAGWLTIAVSVLFLSYGFYNHEKSKALIKKTLRMMDLRN